ncbi:MAG: potassium-transporting ATPase subunit KdpA [Phreatobacter sp.]
MTVNGWLQILLLFVLVAATARPLGLFFAAVLDGRKTWLHPVLAPVERGFYKLAGVDPAREQRWSDYAIALLVFNAAGFLFLYGLIRLQTLLPLNPAGQGEVSAHLAFNTAISFVTNTNWQSYGGETTMSHLTQMLGLTVQNFVSAATGIAIFAALARAFAREKTEGLGNFWVDLTRSTLYLLLPISIVTALVLVALGLPQTLAGSVDAVTLEGANQVIAQGPVASQIAIKQLGTNGGGFFNVNSAHPYENPNAWSNMVTLWAIIALPLAIAIAFGKMIGRQREGWALFAVMILFLVVGAVVVYWAEGAGTPQMNALGLVGPNMEGKEVRFGAPMSALWAVFTTGASNGSVNSMHGSYTPLGGLVPMFLIQLGEVLPGGVGSGLYGIILYAILAMFVAGLMVGRTPEYLGKKLEAREVKLAVLGVLVVPLLILGFASVSMVLPAALAGTANPGARGYSEILYAFSSAAGNNGSAFAGLTANAYWYDTTLGIAMHLGRFAIIVPVMAIAGSLAAKPKLAPSAGTFPTDTPLFVGLLAGVILILGGLQFFPALSLGPVLEHMQMLSGQIAN